MLSKSHADLLEEMVCQRLSQDFQLVEHKAGNQAAGLLKLFSSSTHTHTHTSTSTSKHTHTHTHTHTNPNA